MSSGRTRSVTQPGPSAIEECRAVFRRWLGEGFDTEALDTVLAAAAVEKLDGDPIWLLVISGSGNAKTEIVRSLEGVGAHLVSTIASEGALLSATSKKEVAVDASGGLLRKIGDRGLVVIKDVTSILSMSGDQRSSVLGALREVYDGSWVRNVGTDGGRTLTWEGRIVVIGAVTTAWDRAHAVVSSMGDRFVVVRIDSTKGRLEAGRQAIGNTGYEDDMRRDLKKAVAHVLSQADSRAPALPPDGMEILLAAADLVTLARTAVERDYRGDVVEAHAPEVPTRFAKQLAQVVRGSMAIGICEEHAIKLALRCARDSVPPNRMKIIDAVAAQPNASTHEVRTRLGLPRATVDRELQALHMLGVLRVKETTSTDISGRERIVSRYRVADAVNAEVLQA